MAGPGQALYLNVSPGGQWLVQGGKGDHELIVRDALTGRITCEMHAQEGDAVGAFHFDPAGDRLVIAMVPTRLAITWVRSGFGGQRRRTGGTRSVRPSIARPGDGGDPLDPQGGRRMLRPAGQRLSLNGRFPVSIARESERANPRRLLGRDKYVPCVGGADGDRGGRTHPHRRDRVAVEGLCAG